MVQVLLGLVAKNAAPPDDVSPLAQFREPPVRNPPPETTTVPSCVPYPGGVAFGETNMVGPDTLLNCVVAFNPTFGTTVMLYDPSATPDLTVN